MPNWESKLGPWGMGVGTQSYIAYLAEESGPAPQMQKHCAHMSM